MKLAFKNTSAASCCDCCCAFSKYQMAQTLSIAYGAYIKTYKQMAEWKGRTEKFLRDLNMTKNVPKEMAKTNTKMYKPHVYAIRSPDEVGFTESHEL